MHAALFFSEAQKVPSRQSFKCKGKNSLSPNHLLLARRPGWRALAAPLSLLTWESCHAHSFLDICMILSTTQFMSNHLLLCLIVMGGLGLDGSRGTEPQKEHGLYRQRQLVSHAASPSLSLGFLIYKTDVAPFSVLVKST